MEDSQNTNSAAADSSSTFRYTWLSRVIDAKMSAEALRKTITNRQQRHRIHQQHDQSPSHRIHANHYHETKESVETRRTPTHADIRPKSADGKSEPAKPLAAAEQEQSLPDHDNTSTVETDNSSDLFSSPINESAEKIEETEGDNSVNEQEAAAVTIQARARGWLTRLATKPNTNTSTSNPSLQEDDADALQVEAQESAVIVQPKPKPQLDLKKILREYFDTHAPEDDDLVEQVFTAIADSSVSPTWCIKCKKQN